MCECECYCSGILEGHPLILFIILPNRSELMIVLTKEPFLLCRLKVNSLYDDLVACEYARHPSRHSSNLFVCSSFRFYKDKEMGLPPNYISMLMVFCNGRCSRSTDQMCHEDHPRVHLSEEEKMAAEESLEAYCKPVEFYNIIQRRAIKKVLFFILTLYLSFQECV